MFRTTSGCLAEPLQKDRGGLVAFRVNPGAVERIGAVKQLQEAGRLRESGRADAFHLHQLLATGEGSLVLAVFDDPPGRELIQTRNMPQERDAGGIQIDADEVDAARDDRFQRLFELLGVHVVLVEADADVLGFDLDELGQRILKPPSDRDGAAERGVELGKLLAANLAGGVDAGPGLVDDHVRELRQQRIGRVRGGGCRGRRRRR